MDKITAFVDNVGRVVVGQIQKSQDKQYLEVKEPAVVNVQVNQENGQISVQLLPYVFREFVKPEVREAGVIWKFNKTTITLSDNLELDDPICNQYKNLFTKPVATPEKKEPEVVKLFDDKD